MLTLPQLLVSACTGEEEGHQRGRGSKTKDNMAAPSLEQLSRATRRIKCPETDPPSATDGALIPLTQN